MMRVSDFEKAFPVSDMSRCIRAVFHVRVSARGFQRAFPRAGKCVSMCAAESRT